MIEFLCVYGGGRYIQWMTSFKFLKRKNVGVHRTNFKMKSFHSSHLLFHLFNE